MVQNKSLIFKKVPSGLPVVGQDITVEDRPIDLDTAPPTDGLLVQNFYVSFDPYQRGRMRAPEIKSYSPPFTLDQPITNSAISKVLLSSNPSFSPGDVIITTGACPTQEYAIIPPATVKAATKKLSNPYNLDPKLFLGALGMPGLTAYSSFYAIGEPKKGQTIFISAAAGAVGQLVGQLARLEGMRVVGSVGDDKKLEFITKELGFDAGFNYKKEGTAEALKRLAPEGIDIYYENVGGETLEAAINAMNNFGRIVVCGMISQYNLSPTDAYPFRNLMAILTKRIKMQGFIVGDADMGPKYSAEHQEKVQKWIHEGSFKAEMSLTKGMDDAPEGLLGLFSGKNFGKAVLVVKEME